MTTNKLQRYKLTLIREDNGKWSVMGYWEHDTPSLGNFNQYEWHRDGSRVGFNTRIEAMQFLMYSNGIPD